MKLSDYDLKRILRFVGCPICGINKLVPNQTVKRESYINENSYLHTKPFNEEYIECCNCKNTFNYFVDEDLNIEMRVKVL